MVDVTELEANQTNLMQMEEEKFVEIFLNCRSGITDKNFIEILEDLIHPASERQTYSPELNFYVQSYLAAKLGNLRNFTPGESTLKDPILELTNTINNFLKPISSDYREQNQFQLLINRLELFKGNSDVYFSQLFRSIEDIYLVSLKRTIPLDESPPKKITTLQDSLFKFVINLNKLFIDQLSLKGYYEREEKFKDIKLPSFGLDIDWGKNEQLVAKFSNYISRNTEQNYIHGYGSRESFVIVQDLFSFTQKEIQAYFKKFAESEKTLPRKAVFLAHADMYASSIDSYILKAHGSQSIETDDIKNIKSNYNNAKISKYFLSKLSEELFSVEL